MLAAAPSWHGARFRPAPGHPFAVAPTALIAVASGAAIVAIVAVGDTEFARWVGTGGLLLATLASLFVLLRAR